MKTKILFTLLFFACRIHYLYGQTNLQIAPETLATPEKKWNMVTTCSKYKSTTHLGICKWYPNRNYSIRRSTWANSYLYTLFRT